MTHGGLSVRMAVLAAAFGLLVPVQWLAIRSGSRLAERVPILLHRLFLRLFDIRVTVFGEPPPRGVPVLVLANHVSWLDIPILASLRPLSFVAKQEIAGWPLFGFGAKLQRSIFLDRTRKAATGTANAEMAGRLARGEAIVLFPEGTTGDGNRILPFRSSLVGAARAALEATGGAPVTLQPLAITYTGRAGLPLTRRDRPAIAWYGDMELAPHAVAFVKGGALDVAVTWAEPIPFGPGSDRKRAAIAAEEAVRRALRESYGPVRGTKAAILSGAASDYEGMRPESGPGTRELVKKAFIKSYGCQMNVYDSGRMSDVMAAEGYGEAGSPEEADLVILNTCHIRERAAEKVYSELGRLNVLKRERAAAGRATQVVVAGCVAQAEGREIVRRAPVVDAVVGPGGYHRLPALLREAESRPGAVDAEFDQAEKFARLPRPAPERIRRGVSAFLTVQEGCDKFCAFCVVPYTRGAEMSRPVAALLDEARGLLGSGVRELTLIGQNVNAYHGEGPDGRVWSLARLVEALAALPGVARLRYTTSHPLDMTDDLLRAHAEIPALMPYLHLPVQAGSDRILKAMNRRHDAAAYRGLIDRIRAARPDIALSSDFIVGFPTETDADFEATMQLVRDVGFAASFSFKYSPRPGTPAADSDGQVPEAVMDARLQALQAQLEADRQRHMRAMVGRTTDLLIERPGRHPGQLTGKSPYLHQVQATGLDAAIGDIVSVRITGTAPNSLFAESVPAEPVFAEAVAADAAAGRVAA